MATRNQRSNPIAPRVEPIRGSVPRRQRRAIAKSSRNPARTRTAGEATQVRIIWARPSLM
jgi:hypothetical protein